MSEGGIILPNETYRKTNRGIVLKQGPTVDPSSPFRPGVEVFFPANTDYTIEVGGETVYLVRETDVIMYRSANIT
jgi:co-chaperonin GroES (HSP10)